MTKPEPKPLVVVRLTTAGVTRTTMGARLGSCAPVAPTVAVGGFACNGSIVGVGTSAGSATAPGPLVQTSPAARIKASPAAAARRREDRLVVTGSKEAPAG